MLKKYIKYIIMLILLIVIFLIIFLRLNNKNIDYIEIGQEKYNSVFNLYLRIGLKYEQEYIEEYDGYASKYFSTDGVNNLYKIINFEEKTKELLTESAINDYKKSNNIIENKNEYYIDSSKILSNENYIETELAIKEQNNRYVIYNALSKFCKTEKCNNEDYEVIAHDFKIKKKNNVWIVDEFKFPILDGEV